MQQMAFHCHFIRKRSLGSPYPVYKKKKKNIYKTILLLNSLFPLAKLSFAIKLSSQNIFTMQHIQVYSLPAVSYHSKTLLMHI